MKIHTERSDKLTEQRAESPQPEGRGRVMQALLSRVGRTGRVMDGLKTLDRDPQRITSSPPPATEAPSAEGGQYSPQDPG